MLSFGAGDKPGTSSNDDGGDGKKRDIFAGKTTKKNLKNYFNRSIMLFFAQIFLKQLFLK